MKTMFNCMVLLSVLICFTVSASGSSGPEVLVEDIQVKALDYGATDYAWFLVNCTVVNKSNTSGNVSITLRTIDKWAYDRKPISLSGYLEAGEKTTLSVLAFMDYKLFQSVRKYEVKSITFH